MGWMKKAFAVDPPGPAEPTPDQQDAVDWACRQIAKRHLTTPGLIMLEVCRPLNWIWSQGMHFTAPAVWAIAPRKIDDGYKHFARFLENRGSIEYLARRIEHFEEEYMRQGKAAKRRRGKRGKQKRSRGAPPSETGEERDGET